MSHEILPPTDKGRLKIVSLALALAVATFGGAFFIFWAKDPDSFSLFKIPTAFYNAAQVLLLHTPSSDMDSPVAGQEPERAQPNPIAQPDTASDSSRPTGSLAPETGSKKPRAHKTSLRERMVSVLVPLIKVLAPLAIGFTALFTLAAVFWGIFLLFFVRLASGRRIWAWLGFPHLAQGHVVVCGVGGTGLHLIKEFRTLGEWVVAIEKNAENERLAGARSAGALVVIGDATSPESLRDAGIMHAKSVIAICDRDDTNVEIAVRVAHFFRDRFRHRKGKTECLVHVVDLELTRLFREHRLLVRADDGLKVRIFNFFENSARRLLQKLPLEPFKFGADDTRRVHLVVVGFGQMGRSVALQAAKIGHYANGQKLRISIIDRKANETEGSFYSAYPCIREVCEIKFCSQDAEASEILQDMAKWAEDRTFLTTYVICFDDDHRSLGYALRLTRHLKRGTPIRVRMASDTGLASLLAEGSEKAEVQAPIKAFGLIYEACGVPEVLNEKLDRLARAIHEAFVERRAREGRLGEDPSMFPWDRLEQDFVDSSRQQADHLEVKLRAIGCYRSSEEGAEQVEQLDPGDVELLAEMEHARWVVERRLAGWKHVFAKDGETAELKAKKLSPYLVEWSRLEERQKDWDRDSVREIPRLVALFKEKIYR